MKKISILLILTLLVCGICACGKKETKSADKLQGSWYVEQQGVRKTITFSEGKKMSSVCKIVDKAKADSAGVKKSNVDAQNVTGFYEIDEKPDLSALSEEEQKLLKGKWALICYRSEQDFKAHENGEAVYFTATDSELTTTQKSGIFDNNTGVPLYSDTVYKKNK